MRHRIYIRKTNKFLFYLENNFLQINEIFHYFTTISADFLLQKMQIFIQLSVFTEKCHFLANTKISAKNIKNILDFYNINLNKNKFLKLF